MADSDDEYDRKRRDKFRGERSSGENYRGSGGDRRDERIRGNAREEWSERSRARPDYRDYRATRDRGFSPVRDGPPNKRIRGDWDEGRPRYDTYGSFGYIHEQFPMPVNHGYVPAMPPAHAREHITNTDAQTQPCMLTLKHFLTSQDDSISDSDAILKYNEYKAEFKRQQHNEFFVAHKDEEWFKIKYHPEESMKRKVEQLGFLKKRAEVFEDLLNTEYISKVSVDTSSSEQLLRLLDTVVIKLEGGTEDDFKILDEKPCEIKPNEPKIEIKNPAASVAIRTEINAKPDNAAAVTEVMDQEEVTVVQDDIPDVEKSDDTNMEENDNAELPTTNEISKAEAQGEVQCQSTSLSNSSSSSSSESEVEELTKECAEEEDEDYDEKRNASAKSSDSEQEENAKNNDSDNEDENNEKTLNADEKPQNENDDSINETGENNKNEVENENINDASNGNENNNVDVKSDEKIETVNIDAVETIGEITDESKTETIDLDKVKEIEVDKGPRALHRTSSIFLRNLAPTITKAEVEAMCKRYPGFLRVAIADPLLERRWFRRGWVTFIREVNIKEICWNLNNIRLRDCELGAIVNRDLSRRVRPVNGITTHKTIVRSDIKLCAKIAHILDDKAGLWTLSENVEKQKNGKDDSSFGLNSKNPVLHNITDYLIEEASAEEDELLGLSIDGGGAGDGKTEADGEMIEKDVQLIAALDKLILYLRIVHSVDFYNHCEYPYEDEMPNRCGIIHARGPTPQNKVTQQDVQDYIRTFESKMSSFLTKNQELDEEELKVMGAKDEQTEVEKFITANTQELAKDKWLCPLSGKKFKGPDFIRKHIFNKHAEKVDEVCKEVQYFNNYLRDTKRPQLPEHPGSNKKPNPNEQQPPGGFRGFMPSVYGVPYAGYGPQMMSSVPRPRPGGYGRMNVRGPPQDFRPVIHYRDLDAPMLDENF